jgi:hypothetical protein
LAFALHVLQHSEQKVFPVTTGLPFSEARRMKFTLVATACFYGNIFKRKLFSTAK